MIQSSHARVRKGRVGWLTLGALVLAIVACLGNGTNSIAQAPCPEPDQAYKASHFPWAVRTNPEGVRDLIRSGADINARDSEGRTALHYAALDDNVNLARLLLANGAYYNVQEHGECGWGWYPLHLAIRNECVPMIKLLVESGADVNARRGDQWTPLFTAAYHGQPEVIELLISRGAQVNARNGERSTPLRWAVNGGKTDAVKVLLKHGADPNLAMNTGELPLHQAAAMGADDIVTMLIACRAGVNLKNNCYETPLYYAVFRGHASTVKLLIAKGASVNARTKSGVSILGAVEKGRAAARAGKIRETHADADSVVWDQIRAALLSHGASE